MNIFIIYSGCLFYSNEFSNDAYYCFCKFQPNKGLLVCVVAILYGVMETGICSHVWGRWANFGKHVRQRGRQTTLNDMSKGKVGTWIQIDRLYIERYRKAFTRCLNSPCNIRWREWIKYLYYSPIFRFRFK